ncbi:MAG: aspartate dehydrogenase [Candidatus Altiarchaeota archaeon]|nr:aspartate dehydrogenase [Candidatus Altiarchaeota archaeon]
MKIGLLGCGSIGLVIAKAVDRGEVDGKLVSVYDIELNKARVLASRLRNKPRICKTFNELLAGTDIIVEAASQNAVREHAKRILSARKSLLTMSVGALLDERLFDSLISTAKRNKVRVYIPSGAISGVDGLKSASVGRIRSVVLQTTKNPKAVSGFEKVKSRKVIFNGPASKAVRLFPANVNVSAVLSLAGIGGNKTCVKLVVDPKVKRNVHEVFVTCESGSLYSRVENVPSPTNPKTSYLACLSAIRTLKDISGAIRIGT